MPSHPLEFELMLAAAILLLALLIFAIMLAIVMIKLFFENKAKHQYRVKNKFDVGWRHRSPKRRTFNPK